jgi:hypothetical protein
MVSLAIAKDAQGLNGNSIPLATIMFAGCLLTEIDAKAYGGRIPRETLRACMTTLLRNIGRHNGRVLKKTESSVTACFEDPVEAVKSAINIQSENQSESPTDYPLVVRVAIDYTWNEVNKGSVKGFDENLIRVAQMLDRGGILVSKTIQSGIETAEIRFKEVKARNGLSDGAVYYTPILEQDKQYLPGPNVIKTHFVHGTSLTKGQGKPCFYCGSRSHNAATCPSKVLPQITRGLHNIGFMTIYDMNDAFQTYLDHGLDESLVVSRASQGDENMSPPLAAHYAFYELTRIFQLRFLNAIWDLKDHSSWLRLRLSDKMPLTGGKLRRAFDCLRTYQIDQAEDELKGIEWTNPRDFRFHCLMGFVNVERGSLSIASHYYTKAYEYANSVPQKLYALLLRYRAHLLDGKRRQAEDVLALCANLDKSCPEVIFEDVIAKIASEREKEAISLLEDLVSTSSEYWTAVMISPDLALHFDLVGPELSRLAEEVERHSRELMKNAKEALRNLEQMLSVEDTELVKLNEDYDEIKDMAHRNTFFSWQKVLKAAPALISSCLRLAMDKQHKVKEVIRDLEERLSYATKSAHGEQPSIRSKLRAVSLGINAVENDLGNWQPYGELLSRCADLSKHMEDAEKKIRFFERTELRLARIRVFVKDFTLFLGIASVSAIVMSVLFLKYLKPSLPLGDTNMGWIFDSLAGMVLITSLVYALARCINKVQPIRR